MKVYDHSAIFVEWTSEDSACRRVRNKNSRNPDCIAGISCGVDEARTRDLLCDRKNYAARIR